MLPGLHVDWTKLCLTTVKPGEYEVIGPNDKVYGLKWFWLQMLMGDTADNCPGLEKYKVENADGSFKSFKPVGEKTAIKLLEGINNSDDAYRRVRELYRGGYYGQSPEFADDRFCEQAALMWMRTGPKANLTDFAEHSGPGGFAHLFDADMVAAVARLNQRVQAARAELDKCAA
jgi:hypothetical protein